MTKSKVLGRRAIASSVLEAIAGNGTNGRRHQARTMWNQASPDGSKCAEEAKMENVKPPARIPRDRRTFMNSTRHFHVLSYGRPQIKLYVDETLAAFIQDHVRDTRRHTRLALGILSTLGAAHLASSGIANDTFFQRWTATSMLNEILGTKIKRPTDVAGRRSNDGSGDE